MAPSESLESKLDKLFAQYSGKDLSAKEVRDVLVRDLMNLFTQESKGGKRGVTVMTQEASMYNPATDKIPQRPKGL